MNSLLNNEKNKGPRELFHVKRTARLNSYKQKGPRNSERIGIRGP